MTTTPSRSISTPTLWQRAKQSSLVRNTSWMLIAQGGRLLIQGLYFVLIGRALGVQGFGAFAGAYALVSLLVALAAWGSGNVLIMHVARKPSSFPVYWGNALLTVLLGGSLCTLLALLLRAVLVPNLSVSLVLGLAIAELFFSRVLELSAQAFQAFERLSVTAQLNLLLSISRLVAAGLFVIFTNEPTPDIWAGWFLASTALAALVGFVRVERTLGSPKPVLSLIPHSLKDGWYFSIGLASFTVYNDVDKTMLARLATLEATGIYAAAYRMIFMAFVPVRSLLQAAYARFFQQGTQGIQGSLAFAQRLLPFAGLYGLAATLGLLVLAPMVPYLLGNEYASAATAIRLLAPIPFLQSLHYFAADTLTGAGYQRIRSIVQVAVAVLNVLLNLWLIPRYSWQGAAWATLACEGALVLVLWCIVWFLWGRTKRVACARA